MKDVDPGTLYLVGTPVGNLEDMTFRAVRILKEADLLFCEDTRHTHVLMKHYGIERETRAESFHDHSGPKVLGRIKEALKNGQTVAYCTDGGMPVVSDPGFVLVRAAQEIGAKVSVVPGPSAAVMLFAASGLPSPKFLFHGFFPRTRGEVERTLEVVRNYPLVHIFYEASNRLLGAFEIISRNTPDTVVVLGRELTKVHEEILKGSAKKIFETLSEREKVRGECVIALMGGVPRPEKKSRDFTQEASRLEPQMQVSEPQPPELTADQQAEIAALIKSGVSSKDAAKALSKRFGLSRRVIYEFIIRHLT
ncbi:MAG: 16S rRNA (cytidine(1402)-2'-O)-methyltransferase [Bdellovibrionota bacterium]